MRNSYQLVLSSLILFNYICIVRSLSSIAPPPPHTLNRANPVRESCQQWAQFCVEFCICRNNASEYTTRPWIEASQQPRRYLWNPPCWLFRRSSASPAGAGCYVVVSSAPQPSCCGCAIVCEQPSTVGVVEYVSRMMRECTSTDPPPPHCLIQVPIHMFILQQLWCIFHVTWL